MNPQNTDFWTTASQARDELEEQLSAHADVRFVDIGYPQDSDTADAEISLRVHVCDDSANDLAAVLPAEVAGVPVVISR
ncbi:MAG: hypothetical protein R2911_15175 [Caldilineaceae bacterium]